jgi:hypothetical protein
VSSTITVYAVPFDRLRRVPGSRDPGLAEAVGTEFGYFLSRIDELKKDEDEGVPTCREAVGQIVAGAALSPRLGYLYGYALEAICAYLGRELPAVHAISRAAAWVDGVDDLLHGRGVPVRLSDLVYGGCPVAIPPPDDSPCIGSWPPRVIPAALGAIRGAGLAGLDHESAGTLAQVRGWLEAAAEDPGDGLVGFLS